MQGLLILRGILKKDQRDFFVRGNKKKISIVIKNAIWSKKTTWMHKAKRPSNYFFNPFTYNHGEQIKKGVMCVQIC